MQTNEREVESMTNEMLDLATIQLQRGAHRSPQDGMCVMELASFLAHEPFSDAPRCASPVIAAFLRRWNDALDDADRQQLKPYAERVIGTHGTPEQEHLRSLLALDWLIRVYTPAWLRLPGMAELTAHAATLASLAPLTAPDTDYAAIGRLVRAARIAAEAAARATAEAAARDAARTAARATARATARIAAEAAARATAEAAARAAARVAAEDAARATAEAAARAAARAAAEEALAPTVRTLQASAHALVEAMIAVR